MKLIKNILITGGLGFIGSALIKKLLSSEDFRILNIDFKGYASDERGINSLIKSNKSFFSRYKFSQIDLSNIENLKKVFIDFQPDLIFHLAAESHVDRSIDNPLPFLNSNIVGTFNLLEVTRFFYQNLSEEKKRVFRFVHISTDEVFGSVKNKEFFNENSRYDPGSPYSASKAASDHLVKAWNNTYKLPTIICNCSNNYGPWQFPEKLIPNIILKAINKQNIPIYGDGLNIRDWLYVDDHIEALILISKQGEPGKNYCIGGNNEKTNIEISRKICSYLEELAPTNFKYESLIEFVDDRPGHDKRYAIDSTFLKDVLGWKPKYNFEDNLKKTVKWYLDNKSWCYKVLKKGSYAGERLGQST